VIAAVVFDFDGVLADTEPLHLHAYQDVLGPLGITLTREAYYERYLGFDDEGVFRQLALDRGSSIEPEEVARLVEVKGRAFEARLRTADVLYPGAAACVARLAAGFPLGIASGALKHEIEGILATNGLGGSFRFIVASGDTPSSKPSPDPYLRAAMLHGLPPSRCLAIEDSHQGVESAKAAGLTCIAITHTYPAALLGAADRIVTSLDEITTDLVRSL
jgi:beta-phosphoglucomutase